MSVLGFILLTIARCALTIYVLLEFADYLLMLIHSWRNGIAAYRQEPFWVAVAVGMLSGFVFFAGAIAGGLRVNPLGAIFVLLLMVAGSVLGSVCQWVAPLRSLIKGGDR